jgi:hypothetical protein
MFREEKNYIDGRLDCINDGNNQYLFLCCCDTKKKTKLSKKKDEHWKER